jgi:hypothetical protein
MEPQVEGIRRISAENKRILTITNIAMLLTILIHDGDHVRQAIGWGYSFPFSLLAVNCIVYMPNLVALLLSRHGRLSGAIVTCIGGINTACSFAKIHLLGTSNKVWGPWTKSFFELRVDAVSWWVLVVTILIGFLVAMAGMYVIGGERIRRTR